MFSTPFCHKIRKNLPIFFPIMHILDKDPKQDPDPKFLGIRIRNFYFGSGTLLSSILQHKSVILFAYSCSLCVYVPVAIWVPDLYTTICILLLTRSLLRIVGDLRLILLQKEMIKGAVSQDLETVLILGPFLWVIGDLRLTLLQKVMIKGTVSQDRNHFSPPASLSQSCWWS